MIRTKSQNSRLYGLFSKLGISGDLKESMVYDFTNNRTGKSSEMEYKECNSLIISLQNELNKKNKQQEDILHRLRRRAFQLMYDTKQITGKMNTPEKIEIINAWIKKKQNLDKHLNYLTFDELNNLIKQLHTVRRRQDEKTKFQATYN